MKRVNVLWKRKGCKYNLQEVKFIRQNYIDLTPEQIAERLGRTRDGVEKKIYDLGLRIPRVRKKCKICGKLVKHRRSDYCSVECRIESHRKLMISREELYHLYVVEGLSMKAIAEKFNVGETTVKRRLQNFSIKPRKSMSALLHQIMSLGNNKTVFVVSVRKGITDNILFSLARLQKEHIGEVQVVSL